MAENTFHNDYVSKQTETFSLKYIHLALLHITQNISCSVMNLIQYSIEFTNLMTIIVNFVHFQEG